MIEQSYKAKVRGKWLVIDENVQLTGLGKSYVVKFFREQPLLIRASDENYADFFGLDFY